MREKSDRSVFCPIEEVLAVVETLQIDRNIYVLKKTLFQKNVCNIMNVTVLNLEDIFPNETSRVLLKNSYHI